MLWLAEYLCDDIWGPYAKGPTLVTISPLGVLFQDKKAVARLRYRRKAVKQLFPFTYFILGLALNDFCRSRCLISCLFYEAALLFSLS